MLKIVGFIALCSLDRGLVADGNQDGLVDTGDLTIWQQAFGVGVTQSTTLPGDYDFDAAVDGADFLHWQRTFNSTTNLAADGNLNQVIDAADLGIWEENHATVVASGTLALGTLASGTLTPGLVDAAIALATADLADARDHAVESRRSDALNHDRVLFRARYQSLFETFRGRQDRGTPADRGIDFDDRQ